MDLIERDISMQKLQERTWDCEDFWDVIVEQGLDDALDNYLTETCFDGATIDEVNDLLRFEGESVLRAIGADLQGTIWDKDKREEEELDKAMDKCRDYNF